MSIYTLNLKRYKYIYHDYRYRKIPGNTCYGGLSSQYLPPDNCSECLQCNVMYVATYVLLLHIFMYMSYYMSAYYICKYNFWKIT